MYQDWFFIFCKKKNFQVFSFFKGAGKKKELNHGRLGIIANKQKGFSIFFEFLLVHKWIENWNINHVMHTQIYWSIYKVVYAHKYDSYKRGGILHLTLPY